jgi:hypothetical protein
MTDNRDVFLVVIEWKHSDDWSIAGIFDSGGIAKAYCKHMKEKLANVSHARVDKVPMNTRFYR